MTIQIRAWKRLTLFTTGALIALATVTSLAHAQAPPPPPPSYPPQELDRLVQRVALYRLYSR